MRGLFDGTMTDFDGRYHHLHDAVCGPKPIAPKLKLWVGGRGPKRTPRIAAQYADGFNTPYLAPDSFARRMAAIDEACAALGRDPATLERSVNVGFYMGADEESAKAHREKLANTAHAVAKGSLVGTAAEVIDRIGHWR